MDYAEYYEDFKRGRQSPIEVISNVLQRSSLYGVASAVEVSAMGHAISESKTSLLMSSLTFVSGMMLSMVTSAAALGASLFLRNPYVMGALGVAALGAGIYYYLMGKKEYSSFFEYSIGGDGRYSVPASAIPYDMTKVIRKRSSIIKSIIAGADAVGMDAETMLGIAKAESAFGEYTRNTASSAQGIFQILPSTWNAYYPKFAKKYGIPVNSPNHLESAAIFSAAYAKEVLLPQVEKIVGRRGTAADLYMMYVFGPGGGTSLLKAYARDPYEYSYLKHSQKDWGRRQIRANPSFFYNRDGSPKTLTETFNLARSKVAFTESEKLELSPYLKKKQSSATSNQDTQVLSIPPTNHAEDKNYDVVKLANNRLVKVNT